MINVNELKNGVVIEYDGKLMQILEFMKVKVMILMIIGY